MTKNATSTLYDYWCQQRTNGEIPNRLDMQPKNLPDILDSVFLLERLNQNDVRIRVAGLTLCEMIGREVRGQSPVTFFSETTRGRMAAVLNNVMNRPTIARLGLATCDKLGNIGQTEMILLPLRSDFGDVSRIIGCVPAPSIGFSAPIRFQIETVDLESVTAEKLDTFGFAEPLNRFLLDGSPNLHSIVGGGVRTKRGSNHLRLVS